MKGVCQKTLSLRLGGFNQKHLIVCYSQGAIHTKNALLGLSKENRKKFLIVAIAPAAIISGRICGGAKNYVSKRDFVPHCDQIGYRLYFEDIVELEPHSDAPAHDHDFQSPTYAPQLRKELEKYYYKYGCQNGLYIKTN